MTARNILCVLALTVLAGCPSTGGPDLPRIEYELELVVVDAAALAEVLDLQEKPDDAAKVREIVVYLEMVVGTLKAVNEGGSLETAHEQVEAAIAGLDVLKVAFVDDDDALIVIVLVQAVLRRVQARLG